MKVSAARKRRRRATRLALNAFRREGGYHIDGAWYITRATDAIERRIKREERLLATIEWYEAECRRLKGLVP